MSKPSCVYEGIALSWRITGVLVVVHHARGARASNLV